MSEEYQLQQSADGSDPADDGCIVVRLPADIDIGNSDQVRDQLMAAGRYGHAAVVADMSRTMLCDCGGVRALVSACHDLARFGCELRVVASTRPVLRIFELTSLSRAMPVYPTVSAALKNDGTPAVGPDISPEVIWLIPRR